jgi:3-carboxy-cis,cis-muconate cycloisomerase
MVHEGERSGAAWTLEWLVLPEMFAAAAAGLALAGACLKGLQIQPSEM